MTIQTFNCAMRRRLHVSYHRPVVSDRGRLAPAFWFQVGRREVRVAL